MTAAQRFAVVVNIGTSPAMVVGSVGPFDAAAEAENWCAREGLRQIAGPGTWATVVQLTAPARDDA